MSAIARRYIFPFLWPIFVSIFSNEITAIIVTAVMCGLGLILCCTGICICCYVKCCTGGGCSTLMLGADQV